MAHAAEPTGTLTAALEITTRLLQSDPVLAAEQAGEILKVVPGHPMAMLLLGVARRTAGDAGAALETLQPLAAAQPNSPAAHYELGITLAAVDRRADALAALRRAVALTARHAGRLAGNRRSAVFTRRLAGCGRGLRPTYQGLDPGPAAHGRGAGIVREQARPGRVAIARALEALSYGCRRDQDVRRGGRPLAPLSRRGKSAGPLPGARAEFQCRALQLRHGAVSAEPVGCCSATSRPLDGQ